MKLPASIPLPILALCTSFSLAFAESNFCSPNIVYVTVTPTTTIIAAQQTCGLTIYTTTTQTTTVTVQPSQAVESSSAAGTSVAPLNSVVYTSFISSSLAQGTFSFVFPSSTSEAIAQSSSVPAADENIANSTPSPTTLSTTVLYSATSTSAAATAVPASSSTALSGSNSGQATFYGGNISGGTCSFSDYSLPSGIFGTALSDSNWDDAGNCGACIEVTGPSGNSIKAMVSFIPSLTVPEEIQTLTPTDRRRVPRLRHQPPRPVPGRVLRSRKPDHRHHQRDVGHRPVRHHLAAQPPQQRRDVAVLVRYASYQREHPSRQARGLYGWWRNLAGDDAPGLQLL